MLSRTVSMSCDLLRGPPVKRPRLGRTFYPGLALCGVLALAILAVKFILAHKVYKLFCDVSEVNRQIGREENKHS